MQLLIDEAFEMDTEVVEEINETTGTPSKNYYIHGTFSTPDKKNRNGRIYSSKLWESNVEAYQTHIKENTRNTLGELEHPTRVDVDPMKAVMKIVSLKMENGVVIGRAKILNDNSKETNKLKALIDEGYKIGVSSRGTGRMKGTIVEEFKLSTYDIVQSPSDYNAMLTGISESTESHVSLNESTGKYICDASGCSLVNEAMTLEQIVKKLKPLQAQAVKMIEAGDTKSPEFKKVKAQIQKLADAFEKDIASFSIKENISEVTPCTKNAKSLLENLQNFNAEPKQLSDFEVLARELVEGKKDDYLKAFNKVDAEFKKFLKVAAKVDKTVSDNYERMWTAKFARSAEAYGKSIMEGSLDEARQYSRKEVTKQFEKGIDEIDEALYQIGQHDPEMQKRMTQTVQELERQFKETGI